MAWNDWITKLNPAQSAIHYEELSAPPENIIDYKKAWSEIEIVHRSVEIIINALIDVPFLVKGTGPVQKVDDLLNNKPNPFEDRVRLFRKSFLDFFLDGNAFFYYDGKNLFTLPANNVEIHSHPQTFISHYTYNALGASRDNPESIFVGGKKPQSQNDGIVFTTKEIIHIANEDDQSLIRGTSKLKNLERLIELYYHLINFQKQFFKNNAIPGIVFETDNVMSDKVKTRILNHWSMKYTTLFQGARSPAILDGGLKINKFTTVSFQDLDFENSVERLQQDMAKALGVPFVLLKSGNNANIAQNQALFFVHTVLPILLQYASAFGHFFGSNLDIKPDKKSITALRPAIRDLAAYWASLVNTGIATPSEARADIGLDHRDDCDEIRVPQNITGSATNPSIGGRPSEGEET